MPHIQVLPAVPTFGSKLAQVLGQSVGDVGQSYFEGKARKADQTLLQGLMNNPNTSEMDIVAGLGKLSPAGRKELQPYFQTILGNIGKRDVAEIGQRGKEKESQLKAQAEAQKEAEEQKEWSGLFNRLEERLPYTGYTIPFTKSQFRGLPASKAREEAEAFDIDAFQLERYARAAHTKGALSTKVYNSLLEKIPNSKLSNSVNRGRMKAWKDAIVKNKGLQDEVTQGTERPPLESFIK